MEANLKHPSVRSSWEWPTLCLIVSSHLLWIGVLAFYNDLNPLLSLLILALVMTLHSSLRHEVIHGHPTPIQWFNKSLIFFDIGLFIPFNRYQETHLAHHQDASLTSPFDDPESWYLTHEMWQRKSWIMKRILVMNNTMIGRMILGPFINLFGFYIDEARAIFNSRLDKDKRVPIIQAWLFHFLGLIPIFIVMILFWQEDMMLWYLSGCYFSMVIIAIRTFAEHRAHPSVRSRSIIVDRSYLLSFLFLANKLHAVHHAYPRVSWYRLHQLYYRQKKRFIAMNKGYVFSSYWQLFAHFYKKPKEPVMHPFL